MTPKERPGEPSGSLNVPGLPLHRFPFLSSSPQPLGTLVPGQASPCGYPGCRHAGRGSRGAFLTSRLRGAPGVQRGPSAGQTSRGDGPHLLFPACAPGGWATRKSLQTRIGLQGCFPPRAGPGRGVGGARGAPPCPSSAAVPAPVICLSVLCTYIIRSLTLSV